MKVWDYATRSPRFTPPESLVKKADADLAINKEQVAPRFDPATAAPSAAIRAAARAEHDARKALAQSSGARIMAAPMQHLDPQVFVGLERKREDEAKAQNAADAARKARTIFGASRSQGGDQRARAARRQRRRLVWRRAGMTWR